MLCVFFISFFRVSSVLLNRVKMLYPFPHTSTLRFFAPLLSSLLLLHTFIQTLWRFSYKMKRKRKRAYKHKSCVNKYCCKLAVFHELFSRWVESPCQMPPFAFKTVLTPIQRAYIFLLFSYFYFIFECRNLFHLTLIDERAYILTSCTIYPFFV